MANRLAQLGSKLAIILMIALVAASCGRRGNLEPPNASVVTIDGETEQVTEEPKEDKPFILDPLLD